MQHVSTVIPGDLVVDGCNSLFIGTSLNVNYGVKYIRNVVVQSNVGYYVGPIFSDPSVVGKTFTSAWLYGMVADFVGIPTKDFDYSGTLPPAGGYIYPGGGIIEYAFSAPVTGEDLALDFDVVDGFGTTWGWWLSMQAPTVGDPGDPRFFWANTTPIGSVNFTANMVKHVSIVIPGDLVVGGSNSLFIGTSMNADYSVKYIKNVKIGRIITANVTDCDSDGIPDPCEGSVGALCSELGAEIDILVPPAAYVTLNHGKYVSAVARAANLLVAAECHLSAAEAEDLHGCLVSTRAKSNVGKP
ncbi:hypothetical protein HY605_03840 [Candidatus Peregrinibacteria bacterium]|nr:hypothetical protein [Candidatus Peregrinibacteria bacterium]